MSTVSWCKKKLEGLQFSNRFWRNLVYIFQSAHVTDISLAFTICYGDRNCMKWFRFVTSDKQINFSNYIPKNSQTNDIMTYSQLQYFFRISEVVALSYKCRNKKKGKR